MAFQGKAISAWLVPVALGIGVWGTASYGAATFGLAGISAVSATNAAIDNASPATTSGIPAPAALLLVSIGIGLVGWLRRRRTLK